jgi:integrase
MELSIKLTKRVRKRKLSSGVGVRQERYVLNFRDPRSGQRRQLFFERKKEAEAKQRSLLLQAAEKRYVNERTVATVSEAIEAWIADRTGKVKAPTLKAYKVVVKVIRGPLLEGTAQQRAEYTAMGKKPKGARFIRMLGDVKLNELTTGDIRVWHRTVVEQCGAYTANRAKSHLKSILALAEEDSGVRAPSMPTGLSRARGKAKKVILSPLEAGKLIEAARNDPEHGVLRGPIPRWHAAERAARAAVAGRRLRAQRHAYSADPGARRLTH